MDLRSLVSFFFLSFCVFFHSPRKRGFPSFAASLLVFSAFSLVVFLFFCFLSIFRFHFSSQPPLAHSTTCIPFSLSILFFFSFSSYSNFLLVFLLHLASTSFSQLPSFSFFFATFFFFFHLCLLSSFSSPFSSSSSFSAFLLFLFSSASPSRFLPSFLLLSFFILSPSSRSVLCYYFLFSFVSVPSVSTFFCMFQFLHFVQSFIHLFLLVSLSLSPSLSLPSPCFLFSVTYLVVYFVFSLDRDFRCKCQKIVCFQRRCTPEIQQLYYCALLW